MINRRCCGCSEWRRIKLEILDSKMKCTLCPSFRIYWRNRRRDESSIRQLPQIRTGESQNIMYQLACRVLSTSKALTWPVSWSLWNRLREGLRCRRKVRRGGSSRLFLPALLCRRTTDARIDARTVDKSGPFTPCLCQLSVLKSTWIQMTSTLITHPSSLSLPHRPTS